MQNHSIQVIIILKTNISTPIERDTVLRELQEKFQINAGSVDLDDCDKVLRIVGAGPLPEKEVIETVTKQGFICAELI